VLLVNHGFPPTYNAGSENYTQLVARGLAAHGVPVATFSREEDPLRPDYLLRRSHDHDDAGVTQGPLFVVNNARAATRFADARIDAVFERVLKETQPRAFPCCCAAAPRPTLFAAGDDSQCRPRHTRSPAQAWFTFSTSTTCPRDCPLSQSATARMSSSRCMVSAMRHPSLTFAQPS
jgi:hypothetical protein